MKYLNIILEVLVMCPNIWYLLAYGISIFGSQVVIKLILGNMWGLVIEGVKGNDSSQDTENIRALSWTSQILGLLESVLFTTAFFTDKYEFISIWLVLKVAGGFMKLSDSSKQYRRPIFNFFLIGNGLLILYSFVGVSISRWAMQKIHSDLIIFAGAGLLLLSGIILLVSFYQLKSEKIKKLAERIGELVKEHFFNRPKGIKSKK
jgi:hypothetical protein